MAIEKCAVLIYNIHSIIIVTSITFMGIGSIYICIYWHAIKNRFNKLPH